MYDLILTFIFDFLDVLEAGMLNDTTSKLGNFLTHGYNSLACLLDIFISDRPWKSLHFFWPVLMGFTYAAFTLIYWAAGGLFPPDFCPRDKSMMASTSVGKNPVGMCPMVKNIRWIKVQWAKGLGGIVFWGQKATNPD